MATEIEIKVLDIDPAAIVRRLQEIGAASHGTMRMYTELYDFPDRRLLNQGSQIRLRRERDGVKWAYKGLPVGWTGPMCHSKVMEELEVKVGDLATVGAILQRLGLVRIVTLEKERASYQKGVVCFEIDTWPVIPPLLEIEAPTEEAIDEALEELGIPHQRACAMGPREVFAHYGLNLDQLSSICFSDSSAPARQTRPE